MKKQKESTATKQPFYKKWWFFAIIGIVLISLIFTPNEDNHEMPNENEKISSVIDPTNVDNTINNEESIEVEQEETLTFELIAGQQGQYGKMITYNKGTEFEENFYAFYVPAGTYVVTNAGKYMSQLNVYSDNITKNDAGWEEPAEIYFGDLVDVNCSITVTIDEGQHIEIAEPTHFIFELQ